MISLTITKLNEPKKYPGGYIITMSTNSAIMAYCDTKGEAIKTKNAIEKFANEFEDGHNH